MENGLRARQFSVDAASFQTPLFTGAHGGPEQEALGLLPCRGASQCEHYRAWHDLRYGRRGRSGEELSWEGPFPVLAKPLWAASVGKAGLAE